MARTVSSRPDRKCSAFGVVHYLYDNARIAFSRSVLETEHADYELLSAVNLWA